eukprot:scaffold326963_cov16-Prasinocladus_malaysianus.AAC.1
MPRDRHTTAAGSTYVRQLRAVARNAAALPHLQNLADSSPTSSSSSSREDFTSEAENAGSEFAALDAAAEHDLSALSDVASPGGHTDTPGQLCLSECQMVYLESSRREVHFVVPLLHPGTKHHNARSFGFIGFRRVLFKDERTVLVGWCSNICQGRELRGQLFSGTDFRNADPACFQGDNCCNCALSLLEHLGGERLLGMMMETKAPSLAVHASQPLQSDKFDIGGRSYISVNPRVNVVNTPSFFDAWGVVRVWHTFSRHGVLCYTCRTRRRHCLHSSAVLGENVLHEGSSNTYMSEERFERQLARQMDYDSGCMKLTCISRDILPEEPEDDPALQDLLVRQAKGMYCIPEVCRPHGPDDRCRCGAYAWKEEHKPCYVYGSSARVKVHFVESVICGNQGCSCPAPEHHTGMSHVDGKEFGILRLTREVGFSLELMYSWSKLLETGNITWWGFWRNVFNRYIWSADVDLGSHPSVDEGERYPPSDVDTDTDSDEETERFGAQPFQPDQESGSQVSNLAQYPQIQALFRATRPLFSNATLNFVRLQCIDFRAGFHCPHDKLSMDGIALGPHKRDCRVQHPWAESVHMGDEVVSGSSFHERIFIPAASLRALLQQHVSGEQLTASDWDKMTSGLRAEESTASLLPFIGADGAPPARQYLEMVKNLSYTAPVFIILKRPLWVHVQAISENNLVTYTALQSMRDLSPVLFRFMYPYLGAVPPEQVLRLLAAMLEKAKAALKHV